MMSVISTQGCCGFVLTRGRRGFQAYDVHERAIGIFDSEIDAIDAVLKQSEADLQKQNAAP